MSRTSDHDSSVSRANSFAAQAEFLKCRFPRILPGGHHCFSQHKMAEKSAIIVRFKWKDIRTLSLQIQRYQNEINQGGHPIALVAMVPRSLCCEKLVYNYRRCRSTFKLNISNYSPSSRKQACKLITQHAAGWRWSGTSGLVAYRC